MRTPVARRALFDLGCRLKIATFNINNINKRLPNLLAWLKRSKPDIACLQELKCETNAFPESTLANAGYSAVWEGQKSWNGVAILSRDAPPVVTRRALPGDPDDHQARYIEAAISGILVASIYMPNGNPQPGPKFDYKLSWMARFARHAAALKRQGVPVVFAGDYNVAPTEADIYPTKSWKKDALVQPAPREAFAKLIRNGWIDSIRSTNPDKRIYTFWTYWRDRYEQDHGLRLDHLLLSEQLSRRLLKGGVDRRIRGLENASDHAPVWIELSD
ncbi:Exodeoxyribonuclease III [Afipia felis]|uniref:Exodeoxyribonuclease III n=1 Tax=Afipia felis TaxID=1035 RepID=A0A090MHA9_AFIFE|nr:Exodeoxyribonuclease III [Afipia felis]